MRWALPCYKMCRWQTGEESKLFLISYCRQDDSIS